MTFFRSRLKLSTLGTGMAVCCAAFAQPALAVDVADHVRSAVAITQVFGDGQKLTAVALEFDQDVQTDRLAANDFKVEGRSVTKAYANTTAAPSQSGVNGRFVILELAPEAQVVTQSGPPQFAPKTTRPVFRATVSQIGAVTTVAGVAYRSSTAPRVTDKVSNLIEDDFKQLEFHDAKTGDVLKYNLFVPRHYDASKSYPLVLFMHDAGATSTVTTTTLEQGLGAVVWASPADQAKREAFVLAPQYSRQVVDDNSEATSDLDTTVDLVNDIATQYRVDRARIYTTGQSGGAMLSIAIDVKYPDLFAASFIVAGQWDAVKARPLAKDKLWIVVSEGDLKAFPGENAMTAEYEKQGAKVSRATWEGTWTQAQFSQAVDTMAAEGNSIHYVTLKKGTVVPQGQRDDGGSNHINTWRIAYTIDGIRDWLFRQHR